jgi:hypothetical protein
VSDRFVSLRPGLLVPRRVVDVIFAIERDGHALSIDDCDIVITPPRRGGQLREHHVEELRRWKQNALLVLRYTAHDGRVRPEAPTVGPIVNKGSAR